MIIGASIKRKEDPRLLAGTGRYVGDVRLDGMLHAAIVRSPHAHARIRKINVEVVRSLPGVALVATAETLGEVGAIPIRLGSKPSLEPYLQRPLARRRVRYVGEPVALVIAVDRYVAEDIAEQVSIEYDVLPAVIDAEEALGPAAPLLHDGSAGNLADRLRSVVGDPDRALAAADVRVRARLTVQRHTGMPMETRGLVAVHDAPTGLLTVWGPTKVPHFNRRVLSGLLGWPEERIRFVEPDVGGGFGVRGEFYPEDFLIPWAAIRLARPVQWIEDRREHLMATNHSRQQTHDVDVGASRDGRLLAFTDRILVDMGAYIRTHGVTVPELTAAMLPGPYAIPHFRADVHCVTTNKTPTGTYRSPGRFEGNFVRERVMDLVAAAAGLDPVDVRRKNFIAPQEFPRSIGTSALGEPVTYDVGKYASTLDVALERAGYTRRRGAQPRARARGRLLGIGVACFVEKAGPGPWEVARVDLDGEGRVTVYTGGASVGQGVETVLAQICAEALGVSVDDVAVKHGDTAEIPEGIGAWGSRVTAVGGTAALLAARDVRRQVLDLAARRLEAAAGDLDAGNGRVWVRGVPARSVPVADLVRDRTGTAPARGGREAPRLSASRRHDAAQMTYPYGAHVAVVEVDAGTGAVRVLDYVIAYDVGKAINPMLVEGQLVGGMAQGLGGALLEDLAYARDGQPLATTFMDYLLPTVMETPRHVRVTILEETPTPLNPLGAKGAGEGGTAGAGAAIANAVADALRPLGVSVTDLPLSPDRVLSLIERAKARR